MNEPDGTDGSIVSRNPVADTFASQVAFTRVGVLLSGRGSNFLALYRAMERREIPARIVVVVSNSPEAPGLAKARQLGLTVAGISHLQEPNRAAHEKKVLAALAANDVEWVCLAGYMRLLSPEFIRAYPRRILNIHPSLLPAFPGLEAQRQAVEYGARISGCTVHLVDEGLDSGPIVLQRSVVVTDSDTPESLSARILEQEHRAYPEALGQLLTRGWEVQGRRVVFLPEGAQG